jgi:hypothetical protein
LLVLVFNQGMLSIDYQEAVQTPTSVGNLACTDLEPRWLLAQSVPSASQVPCLRSLPTGWSVAVVTVNNGRSVINLHHDRAGTKALVFELTATCDAQGRRVDRQTTRYEAVTPDQFPGGCLTTTVSVPAANRAEVTRDLPAILGYTSRQTLQQALDERSGGRLRLDPPAA